MMFTGAFILAVDGARREREAVGLVPAVDDAEKAVMIEE